MHLSVVIRFHMESTDNIKSDQPLKEQLEKEYFHLQHQVDQFDNKSLTIKAWSVTIAAAIAGSSAFSNNTEVLLFASFVSLMFWLIDASWKNFQYSNYQRIREIEAYMRNEESSISPFQISKSWSESFKRGGNKRLIRMMFWSHVLFPHGIMALIFLVLYFVKPF